MGVGVVVFDDVADLAVDEFEADAFRVFAEQEIFTGGYFAEGWHGVSHYSKEAKCWGNVVELWELAFAPTGATTFFIYGFPTAARLLPLAVG